MTDLRARLVRLPADTSQALAFFSRLPLKVPERSFDLREIAAAWPLAGMVLALIPCVVLLMAQALHVWGVAVPLLVIGAAILVGGGLHEDGLADVADGFGGGRTREAKLAIMRDSRLGSYGGLALVLLVTLKASTLYPLTAEPVRAVAALIAIAGVSRALALWHWHATLPARLEGLAWSAGRPDGLALMVGGVFGLAAALALVLMLGAAAGLALLYALAGALAFTALCRRQIGGHTGDTIGAVQQVAETLLLIGLSSRWASAPL